MFGNEEDYSAALGFDVEGLDENTRPSKLTNRAGKLMIAGALTPTELIAAWKAGSGFVKIFPCGTVGGAKYIKSPHCGGSGRIW